MIKWFAYILLLVLLAPGLSFAKKSKLHQHNFNEYTLGLSLHDKLITDTTSKNARKQQEEEKKKVKEIGPARRQPKPEKLAPADDSGTPKSKRERRPPGMERPPEIPRRNGG